MKTSLARVELIERFLTETMPADDRLVFTANLLVDKQLARNVSDQRKAYNIIRQYSREQLRYELEELHRSLREDTSFWSRIVKIFQTT